MVNMMESSLTETMVSNTANMYDPMVSTLLRYYTTPHMVLHHKTRLHHALFYGVHQDSSYSLLNMCILYNYIFTPILLTFISFNCLCFLVSELLDIGLIIQYLPMYNTRTLALYARQVQKCASAFWTKSSHCFSHFHAY